MHPHLRPRLAAAGLTALLPLTLASIAAPARAQGSSGTLDPQAQLAEKRARRADLAVQINLLEANDVQLQAEADRLARVAEENERLAKSADEQLGVINEQLVALEGEVAEARQAVDQQQRRSTDRAVNAYMHPGEERLDAVLAARDYDQAHKRRTLLGEVAHFDQEVLKSREQAQAALEAKQQELDGTRLKAAQVEASANADRAAAVASRDAKAEVQAALESRIKDFKAEAEDLAASEGNLMALINSRTSKPGQLLPGDEGDGSETSTTTAAPTTSTTAAPTTTATTAPPTTAGPTVPGQPTTTTTRPPTTTTTKAPTPTTTAPAPTTTRPAMPGLRLQWPLSGVLTSGFGPRWGSFHRGIDISCSIGTPIHAAAAGVAYLGEDPGGFGHYVIIDHGNGVVTVYGHQSAQAVGDGQRVAAGTVIGYSGNTGHSTGPHLHFEVRIGGVAVDPMSYLP